MAGCQFCTDATVNKRDILRTKLAKAFLSNAPIVQGHVLIVPVRHVSTFEELRLQERNAVFSMMFKIQKALKVACKAQGFNVAWNQDVVAGQTVDHFHLHVVPRRKGDTGITKYEPRLFLYRPGLRKTAPEDQLRRFASTIKTSL